MKETDTNIKYTQIAPENEIKGDKVSKKTDKSVQFNKKMKNITAISITVIIILFVLWLLQCLLMPKYMSEIKEGALIAEYYEENTNHDVIFVGDCEVYENISPITLWEKYGITSYIRGSAQQLIWQSYYILEDTFSREKPDIVIYNVQSMIYSEPQSEAYNRMTIDGMKFSPSKIKAVKASKTEDESLISYIFPLLRYHSRWSELSMEDVKYIFGKDKISHNGYLMQTAVRPMETLPTIKPLEDYTLSNNCFNYLDKMKKLCEDNGAKLILVKSPSIYPHWYEEWDAQIVKYAKENELQYFNFLQKIDEIGIDWNTDTYDMGMHLNVYGAEKYSDYLGNILIQEYGSKGIFDAKENREISAIWEEKIKLYNEEKSKQEKENTNGNVNSKPNDTQEDNDNRYNERPHKGYYFKASGIEISVNSGAWLLEEINKAGLSYKYYESASCAYQGLDKFYTFDSFEVLVNTLNGHDVIVSITLLDDLTKTAEGLKIGDSVNKMIEIYGNEYEKMGQTYKYKKDTSVISVMTDNNKIIKITYSN